MKRRVHPYLSRKSPALWLSALCLLTSAALRIALFAPLSTAPWGQIVWPVCALILCVLLALLRGKERLYQTAVPVWILALCGGWQLAQLLPGWICAALCLYLLIFCVLYTAAVSSRPRLRWAAAALLLPALAGVGYANYRLSLQAPKTPALLLALPLYLSLAGLLLLLISLRVHTDGAYHPTWGDRADGRRIRSTPALDQISPYIMVNRTGANNLFSLSVECSEMERYIRRKRQEGLQGFGITHVIIAAYVRTVAKYPAVNRFIAGQKVYSRGEDIALSMTVKKELSMSSPDTVIKVHFNPRDTAEDVYRKFAAQVEEVKNTPLDSGVDNTAGLMSMIPGVFLKFVVWLLKTLDYFGLIPAFLLEISPFHGSAYFTSMASLGISPVYHHLYDFGTVPVFCAFGRKRRATEIVNGETVERKYVDLKFNLDERICDGYYYACVIKHFTRLLKHPDVLDQPPETVEQDIP